MRHIRSDVLAVLAVGLLAMPALAQPPGGFPGGFGGRGGRPGPGREDLKLVDDFDQDGDGLLNSDERRAAREAVGQRRVANRGPGGRRFGARPPREGDAERPEGRRGGPPRGFGGRGNREPAQPGQRIKPAEVENYPDASLFDPNVLRTLFLDFDTDDWEKELEAFKDTDVEVPATLTVDGVKYPGVGVHFRGMSSYMMVPSGYKRSLNVSVDFMDPDQRLYGYKTLNLLNCNGDASFLSAVLYSEIGREHIPIAQVNLVEVVINGESWGVFASAQQFNKVFLKENYGSSKGTRWKVPGSPGGDGGLRYLGEDLSEYKSRFEMKSDDGEEEWQALVELCRVLNETPLDELQKALEPILDIDGALWFLALDVALVNSDGYWTRASDYNLYRDGDGLFHIIPHDINEAFHGAGPRGGRRGGFRPPQGAGPPPGGEFGPPPGEGFGPPPGGEFGPPPRDDFGPPPNGEFGPPPSEGPPRGERDDRRAENRRGRRGRGFGPPGGGGADLDPLVGLDNQRMPLRSRLLAVPELREQYLKYVRQIATESLDWRQLGPRVAHYRELIQEAVERDTRKTSTTEEFLAATSSQAAASGEQGRGMSLRSFAEQRSKFLKNYEPKNP